MSDYIRRDDAINLFKRDDIHGFVLPEKEKEYLAWCIERIPSVDVVERKYGKWIKKKVKVMCPSDCWYPSTFAIKGTWNEEEGWNLELQDGFCSECGKQYDNYFAYNYCPNCGANMKK